MRGGNFFNGDVNISMLLHVYKCAFINVLVIFNWGVIDKGQLFRWLIYVRLHWSIVTDFSMQFCSQNLSTQTPLLCTLEIEWAIQNTFCSGGLLCKNRLVKMLRCAIFLKHILKL